MGGTPSQVWMGRYSFPGPGGGTPFPGPGPIQAPLSRPPNGGYLRSRSTPCLDLGRGTPSHLDLRREYPYPDLGRGYPLPSEPGKGYPHQEGWSTPYQRGWGTPIRKDGVSLHQLDGATPPPPPEELDRHTPVKT